MDKDEEEDGFIEITDRYLHTIIRRIDSGSHINAKSLTATLYSVLISDFTRSFNPIQEYFAEMPEWQESNVSEILKLSEMVHCVDDKVQKAFETSLTKWLVASVANALTPEGCQNQICLVFTGEQGGFKTTFLNNLCPKILEDYLYTGKLNLESKDTWIMLGNFFIINIDDQLKILHKKDSETMKTLITQKDLAIRLPHDKFNTHIKRLANFCGSINGSEFLNDSTGNRRFLPFEIEKIEIDRVQKEVDIDKVWNEALFLYRNGYKYWFDKEEISDLFGDFSDFYSLSAEQELLLRHFEICTDYEKKDNRFEFMTATEIHDWLNKSSTNINMNLKKIGEELKRLKAVKRSRSGGLRVFVVRKRDNEEIKRLQANPEEILEEVNF